VGKVLAGYEAAGHVAEGGHVGGREGRVGEGAEKSVNAGAAKLAVGEGEF